MYISNSEIDSDFVLIESLEEAEREPYHNYRLAYMFTTMREHADMLRKAGKIVHYFRLQDRNTFPVVMTELAKSYEHIQYLPLNDHWFETQLFSWCSVFKSCTVARADNQSFLTQKAEFRGYLGLRSGRLLMANFYAWQRKRLGILVDESGKPEHSKWSFDAENRKKLPKNVALPERKWKYTSKHYSEVVSELQNTLSSHPGQLPETSWLPLTHEQAVEHLDIFVKTSLNDFGPYEDAVSTRDSYLFHSALSPMLNNGLLTPHVVVEKAITTYTSGVITHYPSIEGFVRQIIGWREWVKGMYDTQYTLPLDQYNALNHTKPLPDYFYYPELAPQDVKDNTPLYDTLLTVHKLAWCHHIPRLMILANWMNLQGYNPLECYTWFRSQFVDGAEWVMVPNVLGMGLFADGGIYATKPYISGGNYLKKMTDYPNSNTWEKSWTDLYWEFIEKNKDLFLSNPRMAMIINKRLNSTSQRSTNSSK